MDAFGNAHAQTAYESSNRQLQQVMTQLDTERQRRLDLEQQLKNTENLHQSAQQKGN